MVYNMWYEVERTFLDIISVNIMVSCRCMDGIRENATIVESHRRDKKQVEVESIPKFGILSLENTVKSRVLRVD